MYIMQFLLIVGLALIFFTEVNGFKCYICFQTELDEDCWEEPAEYSKNCPSESIGCQGLYFQKNSKVKSPFQRDCLLDKEPKCWYGSDDWGKLKKDGMVCGEKIFPSEDSFKQYFECRFEVVPEILQGQPLSVFPHVDEIYANMSYCFCTGELCNGKKMNPRLNPDAKPRVRNKSPGASGPNEAIVIDEEISLGNRTTAGYLGIIVPLLCLLLKYLCSIILRF